MKGLAYEWMMALIALGISGLIYILFYEVFVSHLYPYFTSTVTDTSTLVTGKYLSYVWAAVPLIFVVMAAIYVLTRSQKDYYV